MAVFQGPAGDFCLVDIWERQASTLSPSSPCAPSFICTCWLPAGDGQRLNNPAGKANFPLENLMACYGLFSCGNQMTNTDVQRNSGLVKHAYFLKLMCEQLFLIIGWSIRLFEMNKKHLRFYFKVNKQNKVWNIDHVNCTKVQISFFQKESK